MSFNLEGKKVVNNAAVLQHIPLLQASKQEYEKEWKTNVAAVLNISQIAAKGMISTGSGGSIVNISSNVVNIGCPTLGMYSSTKAALDRLTKSMALEWGPWGIRANTVNPAVTETEMGADMLNNKEIREQYTKRVPMGRVLQVGDIVPCVLFFLSDSSKMVTGESLAIDGGYKCF